MEAVLQKYTKHKITKEVECWQDKKEEEERVPNLLPEKIQGRNETQMRAQLSSDRQAATPVKYSTTKKARALLALEQFRHVPSTWMVPTMNPGIPGKARSGPTMNQGEADYGCNYSQKNGRQI